MADETPQTIAFRRSFRLDAWELTLLGLGVWLGIGVFGLFDSVVLLAGAKKALAYLMYSALVVPTLLTFAELRAWVHSGGGSYGLLESLERPAVEFLSGWAYLLGWAALSGLMAWTFADFAGRLLEPLFAAEELRLPILLIFLVASTLQRGLGARPLWRLAVRVAGLVGLSLLLAVLVVLTTGLGPEITVPRSGNLFAGVAALGGLGWLIEVLVDRGAERRNLAIPLRGFLLGGLVAVVIAVPKALTLEGLVEKALPGYGAQSVLAVGILIIAVFWSPLSLLSLRRLQVITEDGVLPSWLLAPAWKLSVGQSLLTLVAATLAALLTDVPALALGQVAAAMFLLLATGVSLTSIFYERRGNSRPILRLPLHPAIPAASAAISFLLFFALPFWARALGLAWLSIAALAYWWGGRRRMRESQVGITVFEAIDESSVVDSEFPVVVPISNPETASTLVSLAAHIAHREQGHLILLQVIQVPEHLPLDNRRFEAQRKLDLLERTLQEAEAHGVPAVGFTRLSRSIDQGILETAVEEDAALVVIGGNVSPQYAGRTGFGSIADSVLDRAACEVMVLRSGVEFQPTRALVPAAEARGLEAARLASSLAGGGVTLLHVLEEGSTQREAEAMLGDIAADVGGTVATKVVRSGAPLNGILESLEGHDLLVLETGELALLDDERRRQLPLRLAERTDVPILLVRGQAELPRLVARRAWRSLSDIIPPLAREEQLALYRNLREAARPSVHFFVLITLSSVIASLGLLINSPAVVIGAMLVAPLMSPILAIAAGLTFGDGHTLREALASTVQGAMAAIFIAIVIGLIVPGAQATTEILARTEPSLIDLMIALASGMAGAYAIARKEVGEALPGVAISAALLPPLASVGLGVALRDASVVGGALLLFVTNLIAIVFAAGVVFLVLGVRPERRTHWLRRGVMVTGFSLLAVSLPLAFLLWRSVEHGSIEQRSREILERRIAEWGAVEIAALEINHQPRAVELLGTLYSQHSISEAQLAELQHELEAELRPEVRLRLIVLPAEVLSTE
ncbi:MAG: TIGR00341 family protein [Anaerolineales bacterium]